MNWGEGGEMRLKKLMIKFSLTMQYIRCDQCKEAAILACGCTFNKLHITMELLNFIAGERAQLLSAYTAFAEDPSFWFYRSL